MSAALQEFEGRLGQLESSLADMDLVEELSATDPGQLEGSPAAGLIPHLERLSSGTVDRRIYSYASCTILLYGLFEQFIEARIMEHVESLCAAVPAFSLLPERICSNHAERSARLILNLGLDKYDGRTTAAEVASRVASCANDAPYHLNSLAYIDHTSNLRPDTINQLFAEVGVAGMSNRIKGAKAFAPFIDERFSDGGVHSLPVEVVLSDLIDLVDRRNTIAHGWPDDIATSDYMRSLISFVRLLGASIHEVASAELRAYLLAHQCDPLPQPLAVFNNEIACFELEAGSLSVGMRLIMQRPDGSLDEGVALEIEVDNQQVDIVTAPPVIRFGVKLSCPARENYAYFMVRE